MKKRRLAILALLVVGACSLGVWWILRDPLSLWNLGGRHLRAELQGALEDQATSAFGQAADRLRYRYQGDPREVLRGLETYLDEPGDTSRYTVAQLFLQCGFETGKATVVMMEMVKRPEAVPGQYDETSIPDLRPGVAEMLALYRVPGAAEGIRCLYENTGDRGLLKHLARVGERRAVEASVTRDLRYLEDKEWIRIFGEWKMQETRKSMAERFAVLARLARSSDVDEQINLAGALYQLSGERKYLDFLVEQRLHEKATRYLSRLQGVEVRPILEKQLYAQDFSPQDSVFIGLYLNHRDSPVVKKYILEWLDIHTTPRPTVSEEVLFRVAVQMNDPEIEASAIRFSNGAYRDLWKFWNDRKDWPLQGLYHDVWGY